MKYYIIWANYDGATVEEFNSKKLFNKRVEVLLKTTDYGTHIVTTIRGKKIDIYES